MKFGVIPLILVNNTHHCDHLEEMLKQSTRTPRDKIWEANIFPSVWGSPVDFRTGLSVLNTRWCCTLSWTSPPEICTVMLQITESTSGTRFCILYFFKWWNILIWTISTASIIELWNFIKTCTGNNKILWGPNVSKLQLLHRQSLYKMAGIFLYPSCKHTWPHRHWTKRKLSWLWGLKNYLIGL